MESVSSFTHKPQYAVVCRCGELRLSMRETIFDLLKERGVLDPDGKAVPGPKGEGVPGPQGKPGNIAAALANCEQYVQQELAKFRTELGLK
jgi:hypothetical protein